MSEEYRALHERSLRIESRIEAITAVIAELEELLVGAKAELVALRLQLQALEYEGDAPD